MGLDDRDYIRGEHPPACTCVECNRKRLKRFNDKNSSNNSFYPSTFKEVEGEPKQNNINKVNRKSKKSGCLSLLIIILPIIFIGIKYYR